MQNYSNAERCKAPDLLKISSLHLKKKILFLQKQSKQTRFLIS
jgi:hypothetical protein